MAKKPVKFKSAPTRRPEFKDDTGRWLPIQTTDWRLSMENIAFEHSKSTGLDTRVVEVDEQGTITVIRKFHKSDKSRR